MTRADLTRIVDADPAIQALAAVLDPARRFDALGSGSTISRIRYKPGSSIIAALHIETPTGERRTGWMAAYSDSTKLSKTLTRAARAGFDAHTIDWLPGVIVGETAADRQLARPLGRLRAAAPELFTEARLLRHNPHRRVVYRSVLAGLPVALKVSAAEPGSHETGSITFRQQALDGLDRAGVPVLRPTGLAGLAACDGLETVPWWGEGDLSTRPDPAAAHSAGRDLARLHGVDIDVNTDTDTDTDADPRPIGGLAGAPVQAAIRSIRTILPGESGRAVSIGARLRHAADPTDGRLVLVHGDFSPDQVLVAPGQTRLIDFDRATLDHPERDLGSFLASAALQGHPELGPALLDGYLSVAGSINERRLHSYTAAAFLQRSVEPFRSQSSDWAAQTVTALDLAESEAGRC